MESTTTYNVNLVLNEEKNGIELHFDSWPGKQIIDELKANNFRWHNEKKYWYAKQTPERLELANSIVDRQHKEDIEETIEIESIENIELDKQNDSITKEEIDIILCRGSGVVDGKMRIYEQFLKKESSAKNVEFLKNEYGIGGSSSVGTKRHIGEMHDSKGIKLSLHFTGNYNNDVLLSWAKVANRLGELIEQDKYLTDEQKEYYPIYLKKKQGRIERGKIADEFQSIVREYNELMSTKGENENTLNGYILSGCSSALRMGEKTTWTTSSQGSYILPLMREALDTVIKADTHLTDRCNKVLESFDTELIKALRADKEDYEEHLKSIWDAYEPIKQSNPTSIVLYEVDSFYEIMGEDAQKIADEFELTVANRATSDGNEIAFVGIPLYHIKAFEEKLLSAGYPVFVARFNGTSYERKPEEKEVDITKEEPAVINEKAEKPSKAANTFANSFEYIGDDLIANDSNISVFSSEATGFYFKDLNIHFKRYRGTDQIHITELENANKKGKECFKWSLSSEDMYFQLTDLGIESVKELYTTLKEGGDLGHINIYTGKEKGVEVFSPFVEVKPLDKVPEKWTKTTFIHALQSGQIFTGEINSRYTDDYRDDYASDYSKGVRLDMSCAAKKEMADWGSFTSARSGQMTPDGVIPVTLYDSGTTKTYYFDINCDIAKGKQRREEVDNARERYNSMMEASCMRITEDEVDINGIYAVKSLKMNYNTDVYSTKEEVLQGHTIISRMYDETYPALKFEPFQIENLKFYSISNFYDRADVLLERDERLIPLGNYEYLVSGKALKEMTEERLDFPCIRIGPHDGDYSKIYSDISNRIKTNSNFTHGDVANYSTTLEKLESEYLRAGKGRTSSLSDLIKNAKAGQSNSSFYPEPKERFKGGELEK